METETHRLELEFVTFVFNLPRNIEFTNTVLSEDFPIQEETVTVTFNFTEERRFVWPSDVPASSRGASREVLERLAKEQRVESMDLGKESETQCSICIEDWSKSPKNIIEMPQCKHMFHQGCLFEWLGRRNSCPLCRSVPYEKDQENRDS